MRNVGKKGKLGNNSIKLFLEIMGLNCLLWCLFIGEESLKVQGVHLPAERRESQNWWRPVPPPFSFACLLSRGKLLYLCLFKGKPAGADVERHPHSESAERSMPSWRQDVFFCVQNEWTNVRIVLCSSRACSPFEGICFTPRKMAEGCVKIVKGTRQMG